MRSLIISTAILFITIIFIFTNMLLVKDKLTDMYSIISTVENAKNETNKNRIDELIEYWKSIEPFLSLTTHRVDLGEIEHRITNMTIAFYKEDEYEFAAAKSSIIDIIGEIASAQSFDLKSIF